MTKIEELKKALEQFGALPFDEKGPSALYIRGEAVRMLPALLEGVELLKAATAFIETPGDLTQDEADQLKADLGAYCAQLEEDPDLANSDEFECVHCKAVRDIENSVQTNDGLVCLACYGAPQ